MSNVLSKDLFNFANLSDLPEEMQKAMYRDSDDKAKEWAHIVTSAVAHGHKSLTSQQIKAVAHRAGITVPGEQTVRNYLKRAVELQLIGRPTRVTYGSFADHAFFGDDADEAAGAAPADAAPAAENDPLAGIA